MCLTEYNEAETMQMFKEEGFEEGFKEGFEKAFKEGFEEAFKEGYGAEYEKNIELMEEIERIKLGAALSKYRSKVQITNNKTNESA